VQPKASYWSVTIRIHTIEAGARCHFFEVDYYATPIRSSDPPSWIFEECYNYYSEEDCYECQHNPWQWRLSDPIEYPLETIGIGLFLKIQRVNVSFSNDTPYIDEFQSRPECNSWPSEASDSFDNAWIQARVMSVMSLVLGAIAVLAMICAFCAGVQGIWKVWVIMSIHILAGIFTFLILLAKKSKVCENTAFM
jgi:hypothetical protein